MNDLDRRLDVNFFNSDAITTAVEPYVRSGAATAFSALDADNPPVHLVLDTDALRLVKQGQKQQDDGYGTALADRSAFTYSVAEYSPAPGYSPASGLRERAPRLCLEPQHEGLP